MTQMTMGIMNHLADLDVVDMDEGDGGAAFLQKPRLEYAATPNETLQTMMNTILPFIKMLINN